MLSGSRITIGAVALAALVACKDDPEKPAVGEGASAAEAACAEPERLGWLGRVAEQPALLQGGSGGWVDFYRRHYRDAAEKLEQAEPDALSRAGRARAHLRLGVLHLRLARLVARAQADYFEARGKLGDRAQGLELAPYFNGVALVMAGKPLAGHAVLAGLADGGPAPYAALAAGWPKGCPETIEAEGAWAQVATLARCAAAAEGIPACPKAKKAPEGPWAERISAYRAALCAPPTEVDEASLTELARSPAATETVKGEGDVKAEVEYFDPVALWALGQLHLRVAEHLTDGDEPANAMVRAWAAGLRGDRAAAKRALAEVPKLPADTAPDFLLLSDFRTPAELFAALGGEAPPPPGAPPQALAAMAEAEADDASGVACMGSDAGKKVVAELGLTQGFARAELRRRALALLDDRETCADALRLLRATQDIKNLESISYVNEPAFLVSLAEAALCMRRSAEAIGVLRSVREGYPEAEAALDAAEGLSVVRLMGGTGGTQKIQ